jgi:hypothetical protein
MSADAENKAKRLAMRVDFWLSCKGGDQTAFMPNSIRRSTQRLDSWQAYFVERMVFPESEQQFSLRTKGHFRRGLWSQLPQFRQLLFAGLLASLPLISFVSIPNLVEAKNFSGEMAPGAADTREAETDARIQILTRPIGALVFLEGEYSMAFRRSAIIRDWGKLTPARKPRAFSSVSRNSAAPAFRSISIFAAPRR